jgi:N-acetylmuramoyl-L-alanine amidase
MIPIRFISEQLGYKVVWEGNARSIAIQKPLPPAQSELPETEEDPDEISNPIDSPTKNWENSLSNISYEPDQNTLIIEQQPLFSVADMSITDLYREKKIIIDLGGDYSAFLNGGTLVSTEGRIKGVSLEHAAGTRLIINTSSVSAVNLYEEEGKIHIQLVKPSEKYEKIVLIDAGHGGSDPGTSGGGILEKDLNIRYATDLYRLLMNAPHIKVYMTREEDVKPSLEDRTTLANEIGASLFVSIHNNYVDNTAVNGTETFYFSNPSDPRGEYFAKLVQANIIQGLGMNDRKAKANNGLYVLRNTTMPSVLIEGGFLSNEQDRMRLTQADFSPRLAEIIYQSILTYFEMN